MNCHDTCMVFKQNMLNHLQAEYKQIDFIQEVYTCGEPDIRKVNNFSAGNLNASSDFRLYYSGL
jgi:hypothetical protein